MRYGEEKYILGLGAQGRANVYGVWGTGFSAGTKQKRIHVTIMYDIFFLFVSDIDSDWFFY